MQWAPPEESNPGPTPLPWPGDATSLPPTAAAGFHIERRRVDTGEPFRDVDDEPTMFVGNRNPPGAPATLRMGGDSAALYGEKVGLEPPDRLMSVEDVLVRTDEIRAPPGSLHQYRVFSLDAIGRRSASARLGPQIRLEKHRPPPQPVGPTGEKPPFATVGVRARLLQSSDPDLLDDDRALLGDSSNAIVVEWGWTDPQRAHDPFAREFRVYFHAAPPDMINGVFTGNSMASGGGFTMEASLDQPLAPDAMKGAYLSAGGYPFKVAAHGAGAAVTVQLDAALLEPAAVPAQGTFQLLSALDGLELRPARWDSRLAVVPITAEADYRFIIRDGVQLNAETPRMRVWVGVATADAEDYVADERDAATPNGGRVGNESSIVAVAVAGRYLGRPDYTPPPPLAVVPELVTNEPGGTTVQAVLDLDALLSAIPVPAGAASPWSASRSMTWPRCCGPGRTTSSASPSRRAGRPATPSPTPPTRRPSWPRSGRAIPPWWRTLLPRPPAPLPRPKLASSAGTRPGPSAPTGPLRRHPFGEARTTTSTGSASPTPPTGCPSPARSCPRSFPHAVPARAGIAGSDIGGHDSDVLEVGASVRAGLRP